MDTLNRVFCEQLAHAAISALACPSGCRRINVAGWSEPFFHIRNVVLSPLEALREINLAQARLLAFFNQEVAQGFMSGDSKVRAIRLC